MKKNSCIWIMLSMVMVLLSAGCVSSGLKGQTGVALTSDLTECQLFVSPYLTVVEFDGEPVRWPSNTLVGVTAGQHAIVCNYYYSGGSSYQHAEGLAAIGNFAAGRRYSPVIQQSGNKIGIVLNANYGYTSDVVPKQGQSLLIIETVDSDFNQNSNTEVYIDGKPALYLLKYKGDKSYYVVPDGTHTIEIAGETLEFVTESEKIYFNAKRGAKIFWFMLFIPISTTYRGITISRREPL
ncbi:MAG: hypothetical protein LBU25_09310 [Treponema sp.]|jgi:hypothetical protein|nr:hypothetical protein [Treponema sp.]